MMKELARVSLLTFTLLLALTAPGGRAAPLPDAGGGPPGATSLYPSPNERLGFGVTTGDVTRYNVLPLRAGWYLNWSAPLNPPHPGGMSFAYTIRLPVTDIAGVRARVAQAAQTDPGALWLIGNEPDTYAQDGVLPERYAWDYGRLYRLIKAYDPTAVVAAGGIVMPTPLRLAYLDRILRAYAQYYGEPMPVDAWHIHNYIVDEEWGKAPGIPPGFYVPYGVIRGATKHDSMELFREQVLAMRQWMADNGYRDRPLYITEYGILFSENAGYDYERVRDFLYATFDYLLTATDPDLGYPRDDNHLVQAWNWFSLDDPNFGNQGRVWAALFDPNTHQRLPMGDAWVDYVTRNNLYVPYARVKLTIFLESARPRSYGQATPARVRVRVANVGNAPVTEPLTVSLYDGDPELGGMLLTRQTVSGLPPRYEGVAWVEADWMMPAAGGWELHAVAAGEEAVLRSRFDLNLDELKVEPSPVPLVPPGETTTITLTTTVDNYGNMGLENVEVVFQEGDPPLTGRVLGTTVIPELPPLASQDVQVVWTDVAPGLYTVTAWVSAPDVALEDDLSNNEARQRVLVASSKVYIPWISQGQQPLACEPQDLMENGGFESGSFPPWQTVGNPLLREDEYAFEGTRYAWLGTLNNGHDEVYQTVTIPEQITSATLIYARAVATRDTCDAGSPRDLFTVALRDEAGQVLEVLEELSECDAANVWDQRGFDLTAYAGQTVQVHFQADTDAAQITNMFVDDVRLEACVSR